MTKDQKNEVIEVLKSKFTQYDNFYLADTENLTVAQVTNLRRHCFNKQVEIKVAKNTLIKKALESLDAAKYAGVYDSLHKVTALMFSESPKEPALIISSFRKESNSDRPVLKAAFLNGDVFVGNDQLVALTKIKTKNEMIGEVIGLLMSPIQRVIGALQTIPEGGITAMGQAASAPAAKAEEPAAKEEVPTAKAEEPSAKAEAPAKAEEPTTKAEEPAAPAKTEATVAPTDAPAESVPEVAPASTDEPATAADGTGNDKPAEA